MYKLLNRFDWATQETKTVSIIRLADNAVIPLDPANRDYAEYLEWLADGNEPLPAEADAA